MSKTLAQRVAELEAEQELQRARTARIFQTMREACEAAGIPVITDEDSERPVPRAELRLVR